MELALVLDGSDSVGQADFNKLKTWTNGNHTYTPQYGNYSDGILGLIDKLQIKQYGTQVGVIKYATSIKEISALSDNAEDIKAKVSRVPWIQGKTNTGGALEKVRTSLFANAREAVNKGTCFCITNRTMVV